MNSGSISRASVISPRCFSTFVVSGFSRACLIGFGLFNNLIAASSAAGVRCMYRCVVVRSADGHGERDAALVMIEGIPGRHRITVAADKGYDTRDFVANLRAMDATPHVAQHAVGRRSAIDARTTRHPGYVVSQQKRKLVEQGCGWMKTVGGLRKLRHRRGPLVTWIFTFTAAVYNIVRLRRLLPATA